MRLSKLYLAPMLALASAGIVGCSDNFDTPPMVIPSTDIEANITIFDLKKQYWNNDRNYIDTIALAESGDSLYVKARVISSDESGNIYKALYIQDETGALCLSIDRNNLYNEYRVGQEVVLSVSNMYIGKYNGLQQLGQPEYTQQYGWEATFMTYEHFLQHVRLNGMPDVSKVDTIDIDLGNLPSSGDELIRLQGQLVRLRNVHFPEADGLTTFSDADASTNRTVEDANGNTIIMRNSSYADFQPDLLPMGDGDIIGILGYYGTDWQLLLRSTDDLKGFTDDTSGTAANPYSIEQAIELQGAASGWVTGYIVGAVAPEVSTVDSNDDVEWQAPTTLDQTLVIGATADTRDIAQCIVMELPQNSSLRAQANLRDNPSLLGTQIWVSGTLENFMGTYGLTGNSGSQSEYKLSATPGGEVSIFEDFENCGSTVPDTWTAYNYAGDKDWFVNYSDYEKNNYASMTGFKGNNPPFETWLVTPALNVGEAAKKVFSFDCQLAAFGGTTTTFQCFVMTTKDPKTSDNVEITSQINWPTPPSGGNYSDWIPTGDIDLSGYTGTIYIGFRYYADPDVEYDTWSIDNFRFGIESGATPDPGPDDPDTPVSTNRADFETFNGGQPSTRYGTNTSNDGWTTEQCAIFSGAADADNSVAYQTGLFDFITQVPGTTDYAFAVCMMGRTDRTGIITSPTISGGCGSLSFEWGKPYGDDELAFRVDIMQNGAVAKTFTVEGNPARYEVQTYTEENINVSGDFSIVFTNLCPTNTSGSSADRVCVWNVAWTSHE